MAFIQRQSHILHFICSLFDRYPWYGLEERVPPAVLRRLSALMSLNAFEARTHPFSRACVNV